MPLKLIFSLPISFEELYTAKGLSKLDQIFLHFLKTSSPDLFEELINHRIHQTSLPSALLETLSLQVELFLTDLFQIKEDPEKQTKIKHTLIILHTQRQFVQRYALKKFDGLESVNIDNLLGYNWDELTFAKKVQDLQKQQDSHNLENLARYAAWACLSKDGQNFYKKSILFNRRKSINPDWKLDDLIHKEGAQTSCHVIKSRDGFSLTDQGLNDKQSLDQAHYCIWCHRQGKDYCRTGHPQRTIEEKNGCPLDQKISEMNWLHSQGHCLAALVVITLDNPMVAATGHRICNDCMTSCIYQKQEPVNIPGVETRILKSVLEMPWGFELYSLLTRWNPLNTLRPYPQPDTNKNVLVAGMGPAGFTLAHYLMNDGHNVVGIDGQKIEPLPNHLKSYVGDNFEPIYDYRCLEEDLDERQPQGFGGVIEYGITVRWNKNFLKIIYILLQRRSNFLLLDHTMLGGNITIPQAIQEGFDHIALCTGAGKPKILDIPGNTATGIHQASDFLMSLQLLGTAHWNNESAFTLRMPIVVVGGGLTAIDTATEAQMAYIRQVEKLAKTYKENVHAKRLSETEQSLVNEFLVHAQEISEERKKARTEGRLPHFHKLLQQWGGVKIIYRQDITNSPSYTLNTEEISKALEEGIEFHDHLTPIRIEQDHNRWCENIICRNNEGQEVDLAAKTILVAIGTEKNDILSQEDVITNKSIVSVLGDLSDDYSGSVVKAIASAKKACPEISQSLVQSQKKSQAPFSAFTSNLQERYKAFLVQKTALPNGTFDIWIKCPSAAENFKPGHFFKIQLYRTDNREHLIIPLTGIEADLPQGLIKFNVSPAMRFTQSLLSLNTGERLALMGPTGSAYPIPQNQNILLIATGHGIPALNAIAHEMKKQDCIITFLAGFKNPASLDKEKEIGKNIDNFIPFFQEEAPTLKESLEKALEKSTYTHVLIKMPPFLVNTIHPLLKEKLPHKTEMNYSLTIPMQCMMKGICGQCIQKHTIPGKNEYIFSCTQAEQPLDSLCQDHLTHASLPTMLWEKLYKAYK